MSLCSSPFRVSLVTSLMFSSTAPVRLLGLPRVIFSSERTVSPSGVLCPGEEGSEARTS